MHRAGVRSHWWLQGLAAPWRPGGGARRLGGLKALLGEERGMTDVHPGRPVRRAHGPVAAAPLRGALTVTPASNIAAPAPGSGCNVSTR